MLGGAVLSTVLIFVLAPYARPHSLSRQSHFDTKHYELNFNNMKKVLIIGINPHSIDFTNPELPPGLTIEAIERGTAATVEKLRSMDFDAEVFLIDTWATDLSGLARRLRDKNYDGVVIGNGIRGIKRNFILFEQVVNVVHTYAPESKIIFNSLPTDTDEAVKRWL